MKYLRNVFYSPRTLMHAIPPTIHRTRIRFFLFSLLSRLPPFGYRRTSLSSRTESFHEVQMVLIFMLLPLLVSREIPVQFILMRVLKSDWTDGERFAWQSSVDYSMEIRIFNGQKGVAESSAIYQGFLPPLVHDFTAFEPFHVVLLIFTYVILCGNPRIYIVFKFDAASTKRETTLSEGKSTEIIESVEAMLLKILINSLPRQT